MTCSTSLSGKNRIVLIAGILMIATTLRVTFTGAAPLLDTIRSAYSLTTAQTGLLTTLPLLAFALISPLAAPVARRFGMERSLFAALLLICAGIAIRSLPSPYLLFGGTAVNGVYAPMKPNSYRQSVTANVLSSRALTSLVKCRWLARAALMAAPCFIR